MGLIPCISMRGIFFWCNFAARSLIRNDDDSNDWHNVTYPRHADGARDIGRAVLSIPFRSTDNKR